MWGRDRDPQTVAWTSGTMLTLVPVLLTTGTALVWRLLWECWDYEGVRKAWVQAMQPADSRVLICVLCGRGLARFLGFLASHPRATFFCFIKLSIVFRPVGLSRSYLRSVVYTQGNIWDLQKFACHGFVPPSPPFQNYCWLYKSQELKLAWTLQHSLQIQQNWYL